MSTLILIGGAHAAYLAFLVVSKKHRSKADWVLAVLLFSAALAFVCVYVAYGVGAQGAVLFLVFANLLFAPLFYLYVRASTAPTFRPIRHLYHFLPFIAGNLYLLLLVDRLDDAQIRWLFDVARFGERPHLFNVFYVVDLVATPAFLVAGWRLLGAHRRAIDSIFSYRERVDLNWLVYLSVGVGGSWVIVEGLLLASTRVDWLEDATALRIGFAVTTAMIFALGFLGLRQTAVFQDVASLDVEVEEPPLKYVKSGLRRSEAERYVDELTRVMREERPYLNPLLTAQELAHSIGLSPHNLSQLLNDVLEESFYDFVNRHRVAEFQRRLIESGSSRSLLELALDCGFSSKSSFNRIFKRTTGETPSRFARTVNERSAGANAAHLQKTPKTK